MVVGCYMPTRIPALLRWTSIVALPLLAVWMMGCSGAHESKLADCKQSQFQFRLKCPSGTNYRMLFGVPCQGDCEKLIPPPPDFDGHIQVLEKQQLVYEFPASSKTAGRCNWLERKKHYGYLLTWGETDKLKHHLKSGHRYDVKVNFATAPPTATSLWLSWVNP